MLDGVSLYLKVCLWPIALIFTIGNFSDTCTRAFLHTALLVLSASLCNPEIPQVSTPLARLCLFVDGQVQGRGGGQRHENGLL